MANKVQEKVANAILQSDSKIIIGGREFDIPAPTYGTLLATSAIIAKAPFSKEIDDNTTIAETIARIEFESYAPEVLATLILGSKRLNDSSSRFEWLKWLKNSLKIGLGGEIKSLTNFFKHECSISEISNVLIELFNSRMELAFFLRTTLFLKGTVMTNSTKETEAIVPTP